MNSMQYKNFLAEIEYSEEDKLFIGHIVGIDDIVGFHGETLQEIREAFAEAVDNYLDYCNEIDKKDMTVHSETRHPYFTPKM